MSFVHVFSQKKDTDAVVNGQKDTCNGEDICCLVLLKKTNA